MKSYEVVRPWYGVKVGQVVELDDELHPALKSNVRLMPQQAGQEVAPEKAPDEMDNKQRKAIISDRLDELGIEHKGNLGVDKLAALLPDGEMENLFPEDE